jgi:fimbrial chaperone protein
MLENCRKWHIFESVIFLSIALSIGHLTAATLDVRPTLLQLLPGQKVGILYLVNQDDAPHTYQIDTFRWLADGTDQREEPTDEIIANPAIITIKPKQTQIIRFGLRGLPAPGPERAYRMIINEVPAADSAPPASGLTVLLRISLPVFVRNTANPPAPKLTASWRVEGHDLHILVHNAGDFTARVVKSVVRDETLPNGLELTRLQYVLVGGSSDFVYKLPGGWAPHHGSILLTVDTGDISLPLSAAR